MPASIPAGLTADHVLLALAELDGGAEHPFGQVTGYELLHNGRRYAPKAVIGLACRHFLGRILQPHEFSGGEAPGQANVVLRRLGFVVLKKGEAMEEEPGIQAGQEWSQHEVQLIVNDYFTMLEKELLGKVFSKTEHRKLLSTQLSGRSKGSIEFKHANISAVLTSLGLPYIDGYKPRGNFQALLGEQVEAFLDDRPSFLEQLAQAPVLNPLAIPPVSDLDQAAVLEDPPAEMAAPRTSGKPWLSRKGRCIDFAERDARNRELGKLGEQFVLDFERFRLRNEDRDDLAQKVEWLSETVGDGLGFDILSFDHATEDERQIEVKTTGLGKPHPFYVSDTEVRCSEDLVASFRLYRVFDFARAPRLYILPGSLREACQLQPIQYRATV